MWGDQGSARYDRGPNVAACPRRDGSAGACIDAPDARGPDVAVYGDAQTYEELHPKYGEVPPRLAVEVLSPNDRADRVIRKLTDYLRTGVPIV